VGHDQVLLAVLEIRVRVDEAGPPEQEVEQAEQEQRDAAVPDAPQQPDASRLRFDRLPPV
jgi:hypothetical protein